MENVCHFTEKHIEEFNLSKKVNELVVPFIPAASAAIAPEFSLILDFV